MRRLLLALAVTVALVPQSVEGQFVLRDDIDGWAWLAMVPDRDAVVQLVRGSPQTGDQSRLDAALVDELRNIGVRRVWEISEFDATESSVVGECTAVDWQPELRRRRNFKRYRPTSAVYPPNPYSPGDVFLGSVYEPPGNEHWMDTDRLGRDVLSGLIHGSRSESTPPPVAEKSAHKNAGDLTLSATLHNIQAQLSTK